MIRFLKSIKDLYTLKRSGLFDSNYYLINYPDVRRADVDPIMHYITFGWKEGRNPSPNFDTIRYIENNADVRTANINPLVHYIQFGRKENRRIFPVLRIGQAEYKISIIIPTYNGSASIRSTLESVLAQKYTNYEIIIVDDGSSDSTLEIVKEVTPSAIILRQSNQGTMAARQTGIRAATGELIALLDQDDIWFEDCLLVEVDYFNQHPEVGFVYGNMQAIGTYGNILNFNVIPDADHYAVSWENILMVGPIALSTALFRKEVVDRIGGLDISFGHSGALGDSDLFVRASEVTNLGFINRNLGQYRWSEMRPGRLESFLQNLQIYAKKYWKHPKLTIEKNDSLRSKFVLTICNYAFHIFRLLLKENNNRISTELLGQLNDFNHDMVNLFGNIYSKYIKSKTMDLQQANTEFAYQRVLLFLYLLRVDLQEKFPRVPGSNFHNYVHWAASVAVGEIADTDQTILEDYVDELNWANDSAIPDSINIIKIPRVTNPRAAIVITITGDERQFHRFMTSLASSLGEDYCVFVLSKSDQKDYLQGIKNLIWVECSNDTLNNFGKYNLIKPWVTTESYLFFMDDSNYVSQKYFAQMVSILDSDQAIGIVTGKAVSLLTKGVLNAGGVILPDGEISYYGTGNHPGSPLVSYSRFVDTAIEECILVRKSVFDQPNIKNEIELTSPEFFKRIQGSGLKIKFYPDSVNYLKKLSSQGAGGLKVPRPNRKNDELTARNVTASNNILVIDDYIPAIRYGSGFPRLFEMLNCLAELGFAVTFFPVGDPVKVQPETSQLQLNGVEVFYEPFTNFYDFVAERKYFYDVVIISRPHVFEKYYSVIHQSFPKAAIIYDAEAIFYTRDLLRGQLTNQIDEMDIASKRAQEMALIEMPDLVISVSEREKAIMSQGCKQKNIEVWGHTQIIHHTEIGFDQRKDMLFVGSFFAGAGSPNEDAALYLAREIFPTIHRQLGCKLYIVGGYPTPAIKELNSDKIIVTGFVENLAEYFDTCKVNVVPTRFASGIPLKLLEAMSYGIPTVTTTLIAQQLNLQDSREVMVAQNSQQFTAKVARLYSDEFLWNSIQRNSLDFVEQNYSKSQMKNALERIIKKALTLGHAKY